MFPKSWAVFSGPPVAVCRRDDDHQHTRLVDQWHDEKHALSLSLKGCVSLKCCRTQSSPTFSTGAGRRRILGLEEGEERVGSTTGFRNSPVVETKYLFRIIVWCRFASP